jgi:hypothetical protein
MCGQVRIDRSHRRDHRARRPQQRGFPSRHALRNVCRVGACSVAGHAVAAATARRGPPRAVVSASAWDHLCAACLHPGAHVLPGGPVRSGTAGPALPPSCERSGGTGGGWAGVPSRLARWPLWRAPRGCGPCGTLQPGGRGKRRRPHGPAPPCLGRGGRGEWPLMPA